MKITLRAHLSQRWFAVQEELLPFLRSELEGTTPTLEGIIRTLEWVRIEEHVKEGWFGVGRPPHERCDLARAFVAKAVLGLETTRELIERLEVDSRLKRICGFSLSKKLPSEATFSRAFAEFAASTLAAKVHKALIEETLGEQLIGHVSRDATALHAREKVTLPPGKAAAPASKKRRGRPPKGEARPALPPGKIAVQRTQTLQQMLAAIPTGCDIGTKKNAKGFKESWKGYKLHIDTADCGVPLNALVSSASMHDSLAAVPLATSTAQRVTSLYDLMDAAFCCDDIREHSRDLGHVPLIDHNPRRGEKIAFLPHEAERYKERSQAERTNARLNPNIS